MTQKPAKVEQINATLNEINHKGLFTLLSCASIIGSIASTSHGKAQGIPPVQTCGGTPVSESQYSGVNNILYNTYNNTPFNLSLATSPSLGYPPDPYTIKLSSPNFDLSTSGKVNQWTTFNKRPESNCITLTADDVEISAKIASVANGAGGEIDFPITGTGGLEIDLPGGKLLMSGSNTYTGITRITNGSLEVKGTLDDASSVIVSPGAKYIASNSDTIRSLSGGGDVEISGSAILKVSTLNNSSQDKNNEIAILTGGGNFTYEKKGAKFELLKVLGETNLSLLTVTGESLSLLGPNKLDQATVSGGGSLTFGINKNEIQGALKAGGNSRVFTNGSIAADSIIVDTNSKIIFTPTIASSSNVVNGIIGTTSTKTLNVDETSSLILNRPETISIFDTGEIKGRLIGRDDPNNPQIPSYFDGYGTDVEPVTLTSSSSNARTLTFAGTSNVELNSVHGGQSQRKTSDPDLVIDRPVAINTDQFSVGRIDFDTARKNSNGIIRITDRGIASGIGTIKGNVINDGTVSPGNSIGTLTIDGDYTQTATGKLELEVGASGSGDLLQINNGKVVDLAGTVLIKPNGSELPTPGAVYTGIATNPGVAYPGGSTANADSSSVVLGAGYHFVRGQSADFNQLNGSPAYDPTKLQFGWVQNAATPGPGTTPGGATGSGGSVLTTDSKPGQGTINKVKQTGGAITSTITQTTTQSQNQCTANTGNSAACNKAVNSGGNSGASAASANNIAKAKAIDAGMTSVFSAANAGITGGESIPSSTGAPSGYTTNQAKAALVSPDFVTVYSAFLQLPTVAQVNQALHSITAEPYASMQSVALEALEQFRANTLALTNGQRLPFIVEEQACEAPEQSDQAADKAPLQTDNCKPITRQKLTPWSLLIDGSNTQATLNGTNDLASLDYNIFSSSYGLQYDFNPQWSAGAAFGYGRANLYNYEYSNTRIDSDTYSGAVWGIYRPSEAWKFTALAGYMNLQYSSDRNISFGGINRSATANWTGNGFTSALAAEYDWILSNDKTSRSAVRIKPSTFFSYALHSQGSFSESGADSLNLAVNSHTADSLIYGLGLTLETPIITGKTSRLIPRLYVGYEYDFNGDTDEEHQLTASFADVPALGSIDVLGQNRGANAVDVALSLEYESSDTLSLYGNVGGAFWSNGNELNYGAGLRLRW